MILAHHIIITGYGHWLPNDPRGSYSDKIYAPDLEQLGEAHFGRKPVQPTRQELHEFYLEAQKRLFYPIMWWGDAERDAVGEIFGGVVRQLGLTCYACAILSNHAHLLVRCHKLSGDKIEDAFKDEARNEFRRRGLVPPDHPVVSAGACHIFKDTVEQIRTCVSYVEKNYVKHRLRPVSCSWVTAYDGWPQHRKKASQKRNLFGELERPSRNPKATRPEPIDVQPVAPAPGGVITVAFDSPLYRLFDYALPAELRGKVQPGQRVEVPFGKNNRPMVGFCVAVPTQWKTGKLKQVLSLVDAEPLIDTQLFDLARWMSDYYVSPIGRTLAAMVPSAVKRQTGMARRTMVYLAVETSDAIPARKSAKRQAIVDVLLDRGATSEQSAVEINELAKLASTTRATIKKLVDAGALHAFEQEYLRDDAFVPTPARLSEPDFQLNDLQQAALAKLGPRVENPSFSVTLLHGVTGSGKTEIYLRLIRQAVSAGRSALVLIPEIALTTQAVDRYRRRLGAGSIAVIHSGLNDTQRNLAWRRIARGEYQVVLGTLSAVFAPTPRLGLIIVDEEQESSFKHLKSPRFGARDVAVKRGQLLGIPVVLGSATPSLETWHNAQHLNRYDYIELPRRVADVPLPKVRVVDMHEESRARKGVHCLSRLLEQQIDLAVKSGRQVVLLLNRRGYASYLFCQSCKFEMRCDRCQVRLTWHKATDVGLCHQCGRKYDVPALCPSCGHKLIRFGLGTQRIEEELATKFPTLRFARVDSDTMRRSRDYEDLLGRFERGELDCMLGTQMIAKGLDFPNVRLVGVVSADTTLSIPDFRSAERTFQLVSQVAGRAGRASDGTEGSDGRVVIQTLHADLPAIDFAVRHDYRGFAEHELPQREALGYPPFGRLALFVLRHRDQDKAESAAKELAAKLEEIRASEKLAGRVVAVGPAQIARIRDQFRYHVLLRASNAAIMQRWLAEARRRGILDLDVAWVVDVDPVSLM